MKKSFIVYPKVKIAINDPVINIIDVPMKTKLKAFITAYQEDYMELPTVEYISSVFGISKEDAHMALMLYSK